jgi:3',5'-cyclic AMP phosphodiesterase CpdA
LLAISDLHVGNGENRRIIERLAPRSDGDWLIVCGDVSEYVAEIEWALSLLSERFARVLWVPGNHDLWTPPNDPTTLRGEARYRHLVELCRRHGIVTPEDPYPVWEGEGGPLVVAPLFLLYDYSFGRNLAPVKEQALALAEQHGVVCMDEFLLHPDPYPSREAWCEARLSATERRLAEIDRDVRTVLVNHFPLMREQTRPLRLPAFAQWCGTTRTADWHLRFRASVVVYGHLHIPRTTWHDGARFEEVSLGYPREWQRRAARPSVPRDVLADLEERGDRRDSA